MTEVPNAEIRPAPVMVVTEAGTRLRDLHYEYDRAKAEAKAAEDRLKGISDAIKTELATAGGGATRVVLTGTEGAKPLQLSWVENWTLDSKKLKAEDPLTYVRYARKGGYWKLAPVSGGSDDE